MRKPGSRLGVTLATALVPTVWGSTYLVTTKLAGALRTLLPTLEAAKERIAS